MKICDANKACTQDINFSHKMKYKLPLRLLLQKKKSHAFCVGTPKSGTHSIANLFTNFRTMHEPSQILMIYLMNKKITGEISDCELKNIFKSSNISRWLEMDSSHYNGFFIEQIYSAFNNAKYILTIRDCISWLDSWFNHQLARENYGSDTMFGLGRKLYYDRGYSYTKHDKFLKDLNIYPVKAYLEFWKNHNTKILNVIPKEKLMIVKTKKISLSIDEFSNFLGIKKEKINTSNSHSYPARKKFNILNKIDKNYLTDLSLEICGDLNNKYLPEKTIEELVEEFSS